MYYNNNKLKIMETSRTVETINDLNVEIEASIESPDFIHVEKLGYYEAHFTGTMIFKGEYKAEINNDPRTEVDDREPDYIEELEVEIYDHRGDEIYSLNDKQIKKLNYKMLRI